MFVPYSETNFRSCEFLEFVSCFIYAKDFTASGIAFEASSSLIHHCKHLFLEFINRVIVELKSRPLLQIKIFQSHFI